MSQKTGKDKYPSMALMQAEHKEGTSYRIRCLDRKSPVTIISPHGGFIEAGTSALSKALAGKQFNLFDFQGLLQSNPLDLHITSTRFQHERLKALLANSRTAVSVHCMFDEGERTIYIGGLNRHLKEEMAESLGQSGFSVNTQPPRYKGEMKSNITNRVERGGVQLELPAKLLSSMFHSKEQFCTRDKATVRTEIFDLFNHSVRRVLLPYSTLGVA